MAACILPNTNIIFVDEDEAKVINGNYKASLKQNWVWNHLQESKTTSEAICQVILKNCICGSHLLKVHKLVEPESSKKIEKVQTDSSKWIKNSKLVPKMELNIESLQTVIVFLIADANLPFSVVERKSFKDLIWLLNEQASLLSLLPSRKICPSLKMCGPLPMLLHLWELLHTSSIMISGCMT
ncbi:uncharacterized protein VP01_4603g2 [Puccinia sorghi]|uniref:Uncharacterized protein n=1 Tax=Puccinia sorghi TaxID=27349 RepID=A0A0L6UNH9_9BASI|nr:uncharacterized protein VP01_4603g2 [Puccinia sorghi]